MIEIKHFHVEWSGKVCYPLVPICSGRTEKTAVECARGWQGFVQPFFCTHHVMGIETGDSQARPVIVVLLAAVQN